jgi:hypothetical protein
MRLIVKEEKEAAVATKRIDLASQALAVRTAHGAWEKKPDQCPCLGFEELLTAVSG